MAWNGSGTVTLLYDWSARRDAGAPDHFIDADLFDAYLEDMADAIEATLNRNGENAIAANISWGNNKITSLADPTAATDAINASTVAENTVQYGGTTGGSSNAYTVTNAFIATVGTGTRLLCRANHTNSGATTLNVNGGGAVAVVLADGSTACTGGEIVSGDFFEVAYDGTSWVLIWAPGEVLFAADIGVSIQAYDADLAAIGALAKTDGNFIVGNGSTWVAESGSTARTSLGLGSLATASTVNNDVWSGADLAVANGGTGASDASGARTNLGLVIGTDVQAYDADTLKADTPDELTAGFSSAVYDAGTKTTGTFTPDQDNGNFQRAVNGGAHTLAPPADNCSLVIIYTNNASAGAITTSGFTVVDGDDFDTTDGNDFLCQIIKTNNGTSDFSYLFVKAMQ